MDRGAWWAAVHGVIERRTWLSHFHFSLSCIGEGNGNPLQCSCLENPRDGGAWWAAVYGVAQSRIRLKRLSSSSNRHSLSFMTLSLLKNVGQLFYRRSLNVGLSDVSSWLNSGNTSPTRTLDKCYTLDTHSRVSYNPKGNQSQVFIRRTDAEAETPILWPPDVKNWLIGEDPDAGKDWRQEEKGTTEDEMVGWHHRLYGHEFEQALGIGDGQGSLEYCSLWDHKVLDMMEWLPWTEMIWRHVVSDKSYWWSLYGPPSQCCICFLHWSGPGFPLVLWGIYGETF